MFGDDVLMREPGHGLLAAPGSENGQQLLSEMPIGAPGK